MGIVIKQSIKGTIFSYTGVLLGFITVGILWPKVLNTDEIGLINFILALSVIFAQLGSLGLNSVTNKLFPHFRDKKNHHHGFIFLIIIISLIGFLLVAIFYVFYKPVIINNNIEKSSLLIYYIDYLLPFTLVLLLYNILDNYSKMLYDAVSGIYAKELLFRILNLFLIVVYYFNLISFNQFLFLYFIIFSIPTLYLIFILKKRKELHLNIDIKFITDKKLLKNIISVSFFGLIGGFGLLAIINIDKIMINSYLDLSATGIYSISALFASLVLMPSRTLVKISGTLIADAWKNNNLQQINYIYKKSCINQLIAGLFIFLMVVTNLDILYTIIPGEYKKGELVIYLIGIANLFDMATGTNGVIIATSKYYKYQAIFVLLLLLLVIGTNLIFIPKYGITGAAIASAISTLVYNLVRYFFLFVKYKFQPFNWKFLFLFFIGTIIVWILNNYIALNNVLLDFLVNTSFISIILIVSIYIFNISEDIVNIMHSLFGYIKNKK